MFYSCGCLFVLVYYDVWFQSLLFWWCVGLVLVGCVVIGGMLSGLAGFGFWWWVLVFVFGLVRFGGAACVLCGLLRVAFGCWVLVGVFVAVFGLRVGYLVICV